MSDYPHLVCKNGHPVVKLKKLHAWQGHVRDRACARCARPIDRKAERWRCNHHCNWDYCEACYNEHWRRVVRDAAQTQDHFKRMALLEAVPEQRRPRVDDAMFQAAAQFSPTPHDHHDSGPAPGVQAPSGKAVVLRAAALLPLACIWAAASFGHSLSSAHLLAGGEREAPFPDPWLLTGVGNIGAAIFCKAVVCLLGYDASQDKEAVDSMSSSVLGVMFGLESGLYAKVLVDLKAELRHDVFVLRPLMLAAAGVLAGTNQASGRLVVSALCAVLAGFLTCSGGPDSSGFLSSFPWLAVAGCITIFRWVFSLNVLPRQGGLAGLWCFAGQMLWPSGLVGFEVAFLSNYQSYRQLLQMHKTPELLEWFLILWVVAGTQLFIELRVVQTTSLWTLGLFAPLVQVVQLIIGGGGSTLMDAGLLLFAAVLVVEAVGFWQEWSAAAAAAETPAGYAKVEEGRSPAASAGGRSAGGRSPLPPPARSAPASRQETRKVGGYLAPPPPPGAATFHSPHRQHQNPSPGGGHHHHREGW